MLLGQRLLAAACGIVGKGGEIARGLHVIIAECAVSLRFPAAAAAVALFWGIILSIFFGIAAAAAQIEQDN